MKSCTTTSVPPELLVAVIAVAVPVRAFVRSTPSTTKRFSEPEAPSIIKPPPRVSLLVPGICVRTLSRPRPFGIRAIKLESTLAVTAFALTSMIGDYGGHRDRLGEAGQLHRQIDGELLTERHDRLGNRRRDEPLEVRGHLVGARRQGGESVVALGVGDGGG